MVRQANFFPRIAAKKSSWWNFGTIKIILELFFQIWVPIRYFGPYTFSVNNLKFNFFILENNNSASTFLKWLSNEQWKPYLEIAVHEQPLQWNLKNILLSRFCFESKSCKLQITVFYMNISAIFLQSKIDFSLLMIQLSQSFPPMWYKITYACHASHQKQKRSLSTRCWKGAR